jgi:hypothetical protein
VNENLEREHDLISNNAYFGLREVPFVEEGSGKIDSVLASIAKKLSRLISTWIRECTDEHISQGKRVNVFLNYQVTDKVNLIRRVMSRIIFGLDKERGTTSVEQTSDIPAPTLGRFITIEQKKAKDDDGISLRDKVMQIIYEANE